MAKCKPCDCKKGLPLWLGTFGDLMSLLLCFFVLLLSMATFDTEKVAEAIGSIEGALSILEKGVKTEINPPQDIQATPIEVDEDTPEAQNIFASLITEFTEMTNVAHGPSIKLEEAENGFVVRLPNDILFESGSSDITNSDAILFLKRAAIEIRKLSNDIELFVIGNSDNVPLRGSARYQDNWHLSVARSISVVKELERSGVRSSRLAVAGDGDNNPIATNATSEGRAQNRRVDLYFYSIKGDGAKEVREQLSKGF